jgi:hypothetical protein
MAQHTVSKSHVDTKTTTRCKPKTCPTCGGVECFERPRFFCGQLLTDKDLDAAQRYVIEKNKLHNRHIVGTGVVCGLPVRCDPCDGWVVIEPGYAIDCCGNDIVVCDSYRFDVLEYIQKCLRDEDPGCEGKIRPPRTRCDEQPKEYCLVISYAEEAARPVTALVRNNGCSTKRCEPSRTKEGFRIDLIVKEDDDDDKKPGDDFWSHVAACFRDGLVVIRKFITDVSNASNISDATAQHTALFDILCRLKKDILNLYKKGTNVRCALLEELNEIEDSFPASPSEPQHDAKAFHALIRMFGRLLQFLIDCFCDALLVPCPPCDGEGVLLACVTIHDGKVTKICNIVRTQVLTGPALRYYLQPLFTVLHRFLEFICCDFELADVFDRLFRPRGDMINLSSDEQLRSSVEQPATQPGAQPVTVSRKSTTAQMFETAEKTFNRGKAATKMGRDFASHIMPPIRTANLLQLTNPDVATAMDVYGLTSDQASADLAKRGVIVSETRRAKDDAQAFDFRNLAKMTWIIPPGSQVELLVAPNDRVTFIRVIKDKQHGD